jgi:hypothetical protein
MGCNIFGSPTQREFWNFGHWWNRYNMCRARARYASYKLELLKHTFQQNGYVVKVQKAMIG